MASSAASASRGTSQPAGEEYGWVPATLYKLGGSEPIHVTLTPDASIGQLLAKLKQVMPQEEFTQYIQRGSVVLLGDDLQSWELNDAYTKFMLTATVKKTLLSGTALHFNLVLRSVALQPTVRQSGGESRRIIDAWNPPDWREFMRDVMRDDQED